LMSRGFRDSNGREVAGLSELLKQLRSRRDEVLSKYDMPATYERIAESLREITNVEQSELERRTASGDQSAALRSMELGNLPARLPDKLRALRDYEFASSDARERFDELLSSLRDEYLRSAYSQMKESLGSFGPEDMQRLAQMMGELNELLEKRREGTDTQEDFESFKSRYGDMLPDVSSLDELLDVMERQSRAMASFMQSLDPEQREELQALFAELMGDMDLAWQMDRFSRNFSQLRPFDSRRLGFRGNEAMPLGEAGDIFDELGKIDELESALGNSVSPNGLADLDLEEVERLLGKDASESLKSLSELAKELEAAGLINTDEGHLSMSPRGIRRIGNNALNELFRHIDSDVLGQHQSVRSGTGTDTDYQTRPYEFGDPFNLSVHATVRNAITRSGGGVPVRLSPEDFEIETTEASVACSTVLLLDLSLSMPLRDNFLPAKKMAMALSSLISAQFPRDYFGLVGFSEIARELSPASLPSASWDYVYGTNLEHALLLGRKLLSGREGYRQMILVTDGEPTAHILEDGEVFFSYPPAPETLRATLREVMRATAEGIRINSFVLDVNDYLRSFIERLTQINRGRVFYVDSSNLGDFVLVDFLRSRPDPDAV
ncbi:MAG: vWA domain-containing protein, partial [Acidimicrobiales bacterium]